MRRAIYVAGEKQSRHETPRSVSPDPRTSGNTFGLGGTVSVKAGWCRGQVFAAPLIHPRPEGSAESPVGYAVVSRSRI